MRTRRYPAYSQCRGGAEPMAYHNLATRHVGHEIDAGLVVAMRLVLTTG